MLEIDSGLGGASEISMHRHIFRNTRLCRGIRGGEAYYPATWTQVSHNLGYIDMAATKVREEDSVRK